MIILGEGGSELAAIRTLRLGAADYLPKRLLTPPRLQRSIKLTLARHREGGAAPCRAARAGGHQARTDKTPRAWSDASAMATKNPQPCALRTFRRRPARPGEGRASGCGAKE